MEPTPDNETRISPAAAGAKKVREQVRRGYGQRARAAAPCCGVAVESEYAKAIGYGDEELARVPEGANLGLGCGNPLAYGGLKEGETVVDLGSGAGFDAFIAAAEVGEEGRVIGVDMTEEMIAKARENAAIAGRDNVEFRLGLIEDLPLESECADVVTSNCVVNLSVEKPKVFAEAYRVLKPGGRLVVSDIVLTESLPEAVLGSVDAYVGCLAGAALRDDYLDAIVRAGFVDLEVKGETRAADALACSSVGDPLVASVVSELEPDEVLKLAQSVLSIKVLAHKPPG